MTDDAYGRLGQVIDEFPRLAIAVSGGVDSMTLATFAHRRKGLAITIIHAVSPAVPKEATRRVQALAAEEGWNLAVTGTGEFDDPRYRDNPADRCYFCKTNLYDRIRSLTSSIIASGANIDDLGDYRPGLLAAAERGVVHPYIRAEVDKALVRKLARQLNLVDIAELPAQPCLASRVETGIAIDADDLAFIERVERDLGAIAAQGATLRCRITHGGVLLEIDENGSPQSDRLQDVVVDHCAAYGRRYIGIKPYTRGSMFVRT